MATSNDFVSNSLRVLRNLDFQVTGYYPYEHAVNLVGQLRSPEPLNIPIILAIEIIKSPFDADSLESFIKFANSVLAQKLIIFYDENFENINPTLQSIIRQNKIDYLGGDELERAISKSEITSEEAKKYQNSLDILSPKRLVEALPELANSSIPFDIKSILGGGFDAWEILEDAVFASFSHCLGYETKKLGYEKRFMSEPEGIVITSNENNFALLYDCKSSSSAYRMTIDDERAIVSYIENKKGEIRAIYNCEISYFVIIGPGYEGDKNLRRENVYVKTNVILVFMKADALSSLSKWAYQLPPRYKELVDLRTFFKLADDEITVSIVERNIREFDDKYKDVY